MIAAGIFSLSGTAVAEIGSSAVIAFVIAALIAGVPVASYSEFASIYAENGGGYLFSSRTFDRDRLEYTVGTSLFLGYTGTTAFYLATVDEWFFEFIVPQGWPVPHGAIGILTAVLLGALNAQGTEESGTFQVLVSGAKVAVLHAFIGGLNRMTHLDTLVNVAARAASEGYLKPDRHYTLVNGTELRLNLHRALDPIRKYANEYAIPDDLLASKSDYDRRITDAIENHPNLTCRSQNTPPINRAIGIDLVAAEAAIDGLDLGVFEGHYRFKRDQEEF